MNGLPKLTLKQRVRITYYSIRCQCWYSWRVRLLAWFLEKSGWVLETDYNSLHGVRAVLNDGSVLIIQTKQVSDCVHANMPGIYVGAHVGRSYEEQQLLREAAILNDPTMSPSFDPDWLVPAICGMDYLTSLDGEASNG